MHPIDGGFRFVPPAPRRSLVPRDRLLTSLRERFARRVVVVHCGAGIPASRYQNFAAFLAAAGIPTLTYDYRGIGQSRPGSLRGYAAELEDWSEYDCAAAIAWLRARFPDTEIVGIAHSVGAWVVGGAGNAVADGRVDTLG